MSNLSKRTKIISMRGPDDAGSSSINSDVIDTLGFDGCLIVVQFGAIVSGAATSIKLKHSDSVTNNTTLSGGNDVATSSQTVADDDDDQIFYIDVIEPTKRYLQLVVTKATQNSTVSIIVILYNSKSSQPITAAAGGSTIGEGEGLTQGELIVHPIDGTA